MLVRHGLALELLFIPFGSKSRCHHPFQLCLVWWSTWHASQLFILPPPPSCSLHHLTAPPSSMFKQNRLGQKALFLLNQAGHSHFRVFHQAVYLQIFKPMAYSTTPSMIFWIPLIPALSVQLSMQLLSQPTVVYYQIYQQMHHLSTFLLMDLVLEPLPLMVSLC